MENKTHDYHTDPTTGFVVRNAHSPDYVGYTQDRDKQDPDFYERRDDILEETFTGVFRRLVVRIESRFPCERLNVLDLGCGKCSALEALQTISTRGLLSVGLDIDPVVLRDFARSHNPVRASVDWLPFPDRLFHMVISTQTLEHVDVDCIFRVVREVERILVPGGIFYIETPNPKSIQARMMKDAWPMYLDEHITLMPPNQLSKLLESVGFVDVSAGTRIEADQQVNELWHIIQSINIPALAIIPWRVKLGVTRLLVCSLDRGSITTAVAFKGDL